MSEAFKEAYKKLGLEREAFLAALVERAQSFPSLRCDEPLAAKNVAHPLKRNFYRQLDEASDSLVFSLHYQSTIDRLMLEPALTFGALKNLRLMRVPQTFPDADILGITDENIAQWLNVPDGANAPWQMVRQGVVLMTLVEQSPVFEKFRGGGSRPADAAPKFSRTNPPAVI